MGHKKSRRFHISSCIILWRLSTDPQTNRRCQTYPVRQQCCFLRLPIHQNQSSGIACCKMDGAGFAHPKRLQCHIVGMEL